MAQVCAMSRDFNLKWNLNLSRPIIMALGLAITPVTLLEVGEISIFENKESTLLVISKLVLLTYRFQGTLRRGGRLNRGPALPCPPPTPPKAFF